MFLKCIKNRTFFFLNKHVAILCLFLWFQAKINSIISSTLAISSTASVRSKNIFNDLSFQAKGF